MKKIIVLSVVGILIAGLAVAAFLLLRRPQVITFSDGAKVTLLAVDYGKRHVPPAGSAATGARRARVITTTNDTLVLWVRQDYAPGQQWESFQYYVYDEAGTACNMSYGYGNNGRGSEVTGVQIDSFPRRQGKFIVRIQEQGNGGQEMSDQKFVISNPARKSFADWTTEPLPDTKDDDDVSVTLTKLMAGAAMPYTRNNDDPDDPMNKGVQATFHVERNGKPVTNWEPVSVETSDATGNHCEGWVAQNNWDSGDDTVLYQYALWPDEPAWKIRLEFSQQSDFADNELWSVTNVPVQAGRQQDMWNYSRNGQASSAVAEADLNGYHLKIFPAKQFTDMPPNSEPQGGMVIETQPRLADGMRLTIAKLTDEQGNDIGFWNGGWNGGQDATYYQFQLRDVAGATNLNLTIALHKSRYFEFTVKPEKAPASDAAQ
ncbi:MAG TPA: hypothetical protein VMB22_07995 [Verrucomicrobiae bacterium]|nr:hypothetical protein [Verrucomicrobiae bacterium]